MCAKCNGDHIVEFEKLVSGKGFTFKKGCIGQCGKNTPMCKLDKEVFSADSVPELVAKLS